jgi:hypothetical protein
MKQIRPTDVWLISFVAAVAVVGSVVAWLVWAHATYDAEGGCPWDGSRGWEAPAAVLACSVLSTITSRTVISRYVSPAAGQRAGISIGIAVVLVLAVVAWLYGVKLQCAD